VTTLDPQRLHALDAVRGAALLLGVAFHASLSFMPDWPPGLWAMADTSTSPLLADAAFAAHSFRMTLFFFIAGFFAHLLHQRLGSGGFLRNRLLRIGVPLLAGWVVLYPLISAVWMMGISKSFGGQLPPMPESARVPGAFPLTHLWFLYLLLQFYLASLLLTAVMGRVDPVGRLHGLPGRITEQLAQRPLAMLLFALPVTVALMGLPSWYYWGGVPTPDQNLLTPPVAWLAFGTAFAAGAWLQRSETGLAALGRYWAPYLLVGALAMAWMLLSLRSVQAAPAGFPARPWQLLDGVVLTKSGFALMHGLAAWGLSLGITGAAVRYLSNYSPTRRYLADASYWIYLAHLPLVAALQVWVGYWPLHWSLKFTLVLGASLALLLASYHWLVRPSLLGQLLNGRRHRRNSAAAVLGTPGSGGDVVGRDDAHSEAPVAELAQAGKRFGTVQALDGLDLQLRAGELLALLGPNGAGKSTAINLWLGLIEADAGTVSLLGGAPQDRQRRQGLGAMMQDVELPKELSPRELVRLACSYYTRPLRVDEVLRRAGIEAFADRAYGKLSGGQKRLAQFAVAICGNPRVLFLDEPSVGLDVQARQALWSNIRQLLATGCSIVLTTHYLEEAEALADRVAVIARGRLQACGSVAQMRQLVARRQISCLSRLSAAEVASWPGVLESRMEQDRLHLVASDAEDVVRRLLADDPTLSRLEVREAGLGEAFDVITREAA
jgi:ABC-type multidrug transport system ATPase subunit/peptidoglycan/LPS O-acetylase OafA/YrhL